MNDDCVERWGKWKILRLNQPRNTNKATDQREKWNVYSVMFNAQFRMHRAHRDQKTMELRIMYFQTHGQGVRQCSG